MGAVQPAKIEHPDQDFRKIRVRVDYDIEDRRGDPEYVELDEDESGDENNVEITNEQNDKKPSKISSKGITKRSTKNASGSKKSSKTSKALKENTLTSSDIKKDKLKKLKVIKQQVNTVEKPTSSLNCKIPKIVKSSSGKFKISDV